jgi:hypothetical protein
MTVVPKWIKSTAPNFYRHQSPARLCWLETIILQHELYIPLVSQLNDPTDVFCVRCKNPFPKMPSVHHSLCTKNSVIILHAVMCIISRHRR